MSLSDEITAEFATLYDDFRAHVQDADLTLNLYDDNGDLIDSITTGWTLLEQGQPGFRFLEIRVTDRDVDFANVVFFGTGGFRYERDSHPIPPIANPREWVWTVKPVGLDE
jgi:hypothetical protein